MIHFLNQIPVTDASGAILEKAPAARHFLIVGYVFTPENIHAEAELRASPSAHRTSECDRLIVSPRQFALRQKVRIRSGGSRCGDFSNSPNSIRGGSATLLQ